MTRWSRVLGLWVVVLVSTGSLLRLSAQTQSPAPAKPDYSKEPSIIESYHTVARFENDGTSTTEVAVRVRVQSDAGVQQYGLLTFGYNSDNQNLKIEYVRVRKPDGRMIPTPAGAVQEVTSDISRAAPMYSDYREKHVAVQNLNAGDLLEYKIQVKTRTPLIPGQFWFDYNFITADIVLDEKLQVDIPKDRQVVVQSPALKPTIKEAGDRRVYTWQTANREHQPPKQVLPGHLPPPSVEISTFQTWSDIGRWWGNLERQEDKPTPEIRAKAEELTQGAKTDAEKLHAIYKYVAEQFRYISISFGIGRYQPHAASEILQNEYGDCKDKQTLLAALLQAVGLKAYPALMNSTNELDPGVPSPGQFDHVISVVPLGQKLVWLDTTTEVAPLGLLISNLRDKQALIIPDDKPAYLAKTPANPPFQCFVDFQIDGKLSKEGTLQAEIQRTAQGDTGLLWRLIFRNVSQSQWEKAVQTISNLLGFGGTVSNVTAISPDDIDHPFHYAYDYTRKNYSDWANGRIQPALPGFGLPELKETKKESPHPVFLQSQEFLSTSKIELPKGYTPQLPKAVNINFDFAEYHSTYAFKDDILTAQRDLIIKTPEVPVSRRKDYLALQHAVSSDEEQYIALTGPQASVPSANPEALKVLAQAEQAFQLQDLAAAQDSLQQALRLDPNLERAWVGMAVVHFARNENEEGLAALHKAIALNPKDSMPYQVMARVLKHFGRTQEAIETLRELLKQVPDQREAQVELGSMLLDQKNYSEAVQLLEAAVKSDPASPTIQLNLARAYAASGDIGKAMDAFKKAADLDPSSHVWITAAQALSKYDQSLPEAQRFAETEVKADEDKASKLGLDAGGADLSLMADLASDWGALGWIYSREGNFAGARKYLEAAWNLSQDPKIGSHLARLYEKMGKRQAAIRMYASVISVAPLSSTDIRRRLRGVLGSDEKVEAAVTVAAGEASQERRVKLGKITKVEGNAEFYVLFSPGPKVDAVKFISGRKQFQSASKAISSAKFQILFPDSNPVKLLRRGIMVCPGPMFGCNFTLITVTLRNRYFAY
ncbi:MAG TPA: DUF3857 domain-containing protein [Terriglobia bacterium]|nr:DUF3857 domain-containing protein [Terriglobia bacterium]